MDLTAAVSGKQGKSPIKWYLLKHLNPLFDPKNSRIKNLVYYLYRSDLILQNLMEGESLSVKKEETLKGIFSLEEINAFLDAIDLDEDNGARDRAIFELAYSSGLRIGELLALNLSDLDLTERILKINQGKGNKDRFVPFSTTAATFIKHYIETERQTTLRDLKRDPGDALFLSNYGRLSKYPLYKRFRKTLETINMKKKYLTLHSIRHTTATTYSKPEPMSAMFKNC